MDISCLAIPCTVASYIWSLLVSLQGADDVVWSDSTQSCNGAWVWLINIHGCYRLVPVLFTQPKLYTLQNLKFVFKSDWLKGWSDLLSFFSGHPIVLPMPFTTLCIKFFSLTREYSQGNCKRNDNCTGKAAIVHWCTLLVQLDWTIVACWEAFQKSLVMHDSQNFTSLYVIIHTPNKQVNMSISTMELSICSKLCNHWHWTLSDCSCIPSEIKTTK